MSSPLSLRHRRIVDPNSDDLGPGRLRSRQQINASRDLPTTWAAPR